MANNKYQNIQLLWTNTLDNPPKPEDLELGQPLINVREGIETLYFRNEKGDGLLEFIEKNSIVDLINEILKMLILVSLMKNWQIKFIALLEKNALTVLKIKMMKETK